VIAKPDSTHGWQSDACGVSSVRRRLTVQRSYIVAAHQGLERGGRLVVRHIIDRWEVC